MTLSDAYTILGLKEGTSSYEDVMNAKNHLLNKFRSQTDRKVQVEAAYDLIFSQQLKARLSGDLQVSNRVRFADVAPPRRTVTASKPSSSSSQVTLPGGLVAMRPLSNPQTSLSTAFIYGGLGAWTLAQALWGPTALGQGVDQPPGLQLALGTAAAVYLLREHKNVGLGKAACLAVGGLVVGTLVGSGIESWLRVDLAPIGNLSSPATVVGEAALIGIWAAAFFLA